MHHVSMGGHVSFLLWLGWSFCGWDDYVGGMITWVSGWVGWAPLV